VPGSLVLIGGEPGIGKSTLLLQISAALAKDNRTVAYVSGEESVNQIKLRAERLGITGKGIYFLSEPDLEAVVGSLEGLSPGLAVIDSIQAMYLEDVTGTPGSISQVRECTWRLERWAKHKNVPLLITGHVTKEGAIAGPGTLEHIVDVVLYFEGERFSSYRLLRSVKNRFGSTNEVGIFEMGDRGLTEVDNPSQVFLNAYREGTVGSVVVSTLEGSRPLLVEIQALTTPNSFGPPRRIANGVDFNRLLLIIAVLSKRAGLKLFNQDVIVNVTGGLRLNEPAVDLGNRIGHRLQLPGSQPDCRPGGSRRSRAERRTERNIPDREKDRGSRQARIQVLPRTQTPFKQRKRCAEASPRRGYQAARSRLGGRSSVAGADKGRVETAANAES
jgi:DNA repair protein RadA/Sms